jgi:RNA polymerase sigma-B factor
VSYVSPQSAEDEAWVQEALVRYFESRDHDLRDAIVDRTLWLAARGARRFSDAGEPVDDLVQVARIGLLKAIERYDPVHGVQFGAFATPTIMGELRRYFRDHTWSLHVSRRAKDLRPSVNQATESLMKSLGRSPSVAELAQHLKLPEDTIIEVLEANNAYRSYSLDPVSGHAPSVDADFDGALDREVIAGLLNRLQPRERRILHLRFFEELSQSQIAEVIGTSQVHVGRLIASSLAELRVHMTAQSDPDDLPQTG